MMKNIFVILVLALIAGAVYLIINSSQEDNSSSDYQQNGHVRDAGGTRANITISELPPSRAWWLLTSRTSSADRLPHGANVVL